MTGGETAYETAILSTRQADADAAIAAIAAEFAAEAPSEEVEAAPAGEVQPDLETPKPEEAALREKPAEAAETDRGMLRLIEKETALREREAALDKKLVELESKLAKLSEPAPIPPRPNYREEIERDPLKFFTDAGIEPEQVSRLIIAAKMGDKTPEDIRRALGDYPMKRELQELRQMIQQRDAQAEVSKVRMQATEHVSRAEGISKYPALAAVAKVDPKYAAEAVFEEIARDAQARNIPIGGTYLSTDEAAAKVEARWELFRKAFVATPETSQNAAAPATNASPGASPKPETTPANAGKPAAKPRAPAPRKNYWDSDDDWETQKRAAIQEAIAVFRNG